MRPEAARHRSSPRALPAFALLLAGCGGGDAGPTIHPVSGKVLVDGRPAAKAQVTFHPSPGQTAGMIPMAEIAADGSFRPSTRMSGDGAPAGDYTLTILWPEFKLDHGEEVAGPDRLGGRYNDPRKSGLKVIIKAGENSLPPIELKSTR